jgi:hypothetical protein
MFIFEMLCHTHFAEYNRTYINATVDTLSSETGREEIRKDVILDGRSGRIILK